MAVQTLEFGKLFLTFSNHLHPVTAQRAFESDPELRRQIDGATLFQQLSALRRLPISECFDVLDRVEQGPVATRYLYWWVVYWKQFELTHERLPRAREFSVAHFGEDSVEGAMLELMRGSAHYESGDIESALEVLLALLETMDALEDTAEAVVRDFGAVAARIQIVRILHRQTRFALAEGMLKESLRLCRKWGFLAEMGVRQALADLEWRRGRIAEALELHRNSDLRERARRSELSHWLLYSHLDAGKCALDLGNTVLAERELEAARQVMAAGFRHLSSHEGYHRLYSAELARLRGARDDARQFLAEAFESWQAAARPNHIALRDAALVKSAWAVEDRDSVALREGLTLIRRSLPKQADTYFAGRVRAQMRRLAAIRDAEGLELLRKAWKETARAGPPPRVDALERG